MVGLIKGAGDVSGNLVIFSSISWGSPYIPADIMHLLQDGSLLALLHCEVKPKMNSCKHGNIEPALFYFQGLLS